MYVLSDNVNITMNIKKKITRISYFEYIEKFLIAPPKSTLDNMDSKLQYKFFATRHHIAHMKLITS